MVPVLPDTRPDSPTFTVIAIHDPRYREPLLLATPLALPPQLVRGLYRDRWPVEQIPLAAKQMLGAARQFVHEPEIARDLSALAGTGPHRWCHRQLCRGHAAGRADRLLGPATATDAGAAAAGLGAPSIFA